MGIIFSFPLTILQIINSNVRFAFPTRLSNSLMYIAEKAMNIPKVGIIFFFIIAVIAVVLYISTTLLLLKMGYEATKHILEYGLRPNPNYTDPIDGRTVKVETVDGETAYLDSKAMWLQVVYRDEWDDMIKDPISNDVINQRESLLPDILQGDINDEDNVPKVYDLAYMNVKPETLNWSKYLRDFGDSVNKFVNRIGDKFIFTWIILPFVLYRYALIVNKIVEDFYATGSTSFNFRKLIIITFFFL